MKLRQSLNAVFLSSLISVVALGADKTQEILDNTVKPVATSIEGLLKNISAHEAGTFMTKADVEKGVKDSAACEETLKGVFTKIEPFRKVPVAGLGEVSIGDMRKLCVRDLGMTFKGMLDTENYAGGKPQKKIVKAAIPPPP